MNRFAVQRVNVQEPIRASWANSLVDSVNLLQGAVPAPQQRREPAPTFYNDSGDIEGAEPVGDELWLEVARTTSTVRVENPDDANQYVDVERIDAICFFTPRGRVQLLFNNP